VAGDVDYLVSEDGHLLSLGSSAASISSSREPSTNDSIVGNSHRS
jgi:hypothetical protein